MKKGTPKKETTLDTLARMMKQGFDRMDERFEHVDKKFEQVDERLKSLEYEQRETNRRLAVIERKQTGVLESLDNTVTKKEFQVLAGRVKVLEAKVK